ncbi:MAG: hypothetical protein F6K42_34715, partial [Leptolyngbya sp. SIO1D8]|nr:hypothetical protein [Leptolyngbya sp. SIO1D8]
EYEEDREKEENTVKSWQALAKWFNDQPELGDPVFVSIDENGSLDEDAMVGSVFPRLVIALTEAGSLVGLFSCVVHT